MRIHFKTILRLFAAAAAIALSCFPALAQQTLGGITGDVTDPSGSMIPGATVTLADEQTGYSRITVTNGAGAYVFVNLPIGSYTLTYKAEGYEVQKTQHITVQANRTATVNAGLKVGQTTTTIEVEATPLMNAVDTTNGYVMETAQIAETPDFSMHLCSNPINVLAKKLSSGSLMKRSTAPA